MYGAIFKIMSFSLGKSCVVVYAYIPRQINLSKDKVSHFFSSSGFLGLVLSFDEPVILKST